MYTRFFGLNEKPFAITPNPRYLYMSERHAEALAHLMYGLNEAGGFIQLTGEVGTGKTTVIRTLLEQLPEHADVALILNPALNPGEFLQAICQELHIALIPTDVGGSKQMIDALNAHLLEKHGKGRRVVVIVDEAQNLGADTLEQVRMLTNLETATHKLLQIILIGQPELREVLARSELRQLAQRITGRYHLAPLSREDTAAYIHHRMKVAGASGQIFSDSAISEIHRRSGGVPRLTNIICDRALLGAYTVEEHWIEASLIKQAANEIDGHWRLRRWWPWLKWAIAPIAMIAAMSGGWLLANRATPRHPVVTAAPALLPTLNASASTIDIASLFTKVGANASTDSALVGLFSLWHIKLDPTATSPCDQASLSGLECAYQKGTWSQLMTLNRPAILQLNDDTGNVHQFVLASVKNDNAKVLIDNALYEATVASLARYWNGDYLLVWRPQVVSHQTLSLGMRNNDIVWLRNALNTTQFGSASSSSSETSGAATSVKTKNLFDETLMKQVIEFQRTHHLNADGVVGVQTQIALDSLLNPDHGPLLVTSPTS